jgi:hypothetical protein
MEMSKIIKNIINIILILLSTVLLYYFMVLPSQHLIVVLGPGEHSILFKKHIKSSYIHKFKPNLVFADLTKGNDTLPISVGRYFTIKYYKLNIHGKIVPLTDEEAIEIQHMIASYADGSLLVIYKW